MNETLQDQEWKVSIDYTCLKNSKIYLAQPNKSDTYGYHQNQKAFSNGYPESVEWNGGME